MQAMLEPWRCESPAEDMSRKSCGPVAGMFYTSNAAATASTAKNVEAGATRFVRAPELTDKDPESAQGSGEMNCRKETYWGGTPVTLTVKTATRPSIAGRPSTAILFIPTRQALGRYDVISGRSS